MNILHTNDWGRFITETIIAENGKAMISIDYESEKKNIAFIHDFSVIPPARKQGIGKELLSLAIEQAKKRGCKAVELNYNSETTPLWVFDWYERNGFDEKEFGGHNSLMRKEL